MLRSEVDVGKYWPGTVQAIVQELEGGVAHAGVGILGAQRLLDTLVVEGGPSFVRAVPRVPAVPAPRDAPAGVVVQVLAEQAGPVPGVVQPGGDVAVLET